jgi:hypothetical protein
MNDPGEMYRPTCGKAFGAGIPHVTGPALFVAMP